MLDSATKDLLEKGFTDANDANALGTRATDGKKHLPLPNGISVGDSWSLPQSHLTGVHL